MNHSELRSARASVALARAVDAMNAGFTSKAGQKEALSDLNRSYDQLEEMLRDEVRKVAPHNGLGREMTREEYVERMAHFDANEIPFDLHQVRERHLELFAKWTGNADAVRQLLQLRETIKAAPVVPPMKDESKVLADRIVESIKARMDRLQVRYLEAIDLTTVFEDGFYMKGLTANSHYVTNEHGTTFLRTFFYLNGRLTPLNVILAAAQEAKRLEEEGR